MEKIKLTNGKTLDIYNIYVADDRLYINILNSSLAEVEGLFTEENILSITDLDNDGNVSNIFNGYTDINMISKSKEYVSKFYLGLSTELDSGDEEVDVCKVVLKLSTDLDKQLKLALEKIENLVVDQDKVKSENEELKTKVSEMDEMLSMVLMNSLEEDINNTEGEVE